MLLATLTPAPAVAVADSTAPAMETLIVRAARQPIPAAEMGSSVSVLDADLLQARQSVALAEILRAVPGVAVSRAGVAGSQTQLRLRGSEANHVLVFIDGIKVNDPAQNSEFNMAHLLNYDIASVEVIRGPQSALWGSDALAGVINVTTRRPDREGVRADLFAEGGSDGWQHLGATAAYGDERLRASLSANSLDTDGQNISRTGSEDDGYRNRTVNGGFSYGVTEKLQLAGEVRYTDAKNDFDSVDFSTGLPADSRDHSESEQLYGLLEIRLQSLEGRLVHRAGVTLADTDNRNHTENPFASSGFDVNTARAEVTTWGYQAGFALNDAHELTGAVEYREETFEQRGPVVWGDPNRDEELDSTAWIAEYRGKLTPSLSLLASLRRDTNSDFDDSTTGRISAAWLLDEGRTKLRGAWGEGVKNPTFIERFGYFTDFIGNPDLRPEESSGWELGIDQQLLDDRISLGLTWFDEELRHEINGFVFDPQALAFTAANESGKSRRRGLEFNSGWLIGAGLSVNLAYTWLDASEDDKAGGSSDEIRRPRHIGSANLNWNFAGDRANLNLNIDYNGEQDDIFFPPLPPYQQRVQLDDFTLVTLAASYRLTDAVRLFARVENALDEDYEEVFGYATPGRAGVVGISYTLGN